MSIVKDNVMYIFLNLSKRIEGTIMLLYLHRNKTWKFLRMKPQYPIQPPEVSATPIKLLPNLPLRDGGQD